MANYQQLEVQRDLIEQALIAAKREVERLETARAAVHLRIGVLIHNGALGAIQDDEGRCLTTGAARLRDDNGQEG